MELKKELYWPLENKENGAKIIWFGVSERGFQVKDDITWIIFNGWQKYIYKEVKLFIFVCKQIIM